MEAEVATPFISASSSRSSSTSSSSSSGRTSKKWIFLKDLLYRSKSEGRERNHQREVLALDLFLLVQSQNQTFAVDSFRRCWCRCRLLFFHQYDLGGREGEIEESTVVVRLFFKENDGEAGKWVGSPEGAGVVATRATQHVELGAGGGDAVEDIPPTRGPLGVLNGGNNGVEGDQAATDGAEKEEEEKWSLKRRWGPLGARERRMRRSRSRVT